MLDSSARLAPYEKVKFVRIMFQSLNWRLTAEESTRVELDARSDMSELTEAYRNPMNCVAQMYETELLSFITDLWIVS
jgi:hypothetical protein